MYSLESIRMYLCIHVLDNFVLVGYSYITSLRLARSQVKMLMRGETNLNEHAIVYTSRGLLSILTTTPY